MAILPNSRPSTGWRRGYLTNNCIKEIFDVGETRVFQNLNGKIVTTTPRSSTPRRGGRRMGAAPGCCRRGPVSGMACGSSIAEGERQNGGFRWRRAAELTRYGGIWREQGSSRARCCSTTGGQRGRSKAAVLARTNLARLQVVVEVGNGRGDSEDLSDEAGPGLVVGVSMAAPGYLRQRRKDRA